MIFNQSDADSQNSILKGHEIVGVRCINLVIQFDTDLTGLLFGADLLIQKSGGIMFIGVIQNSFQITAGIKLLSASA